MLQISAMKLNVLKLRLPSIKIFRFTNYCKSKPIKTIKSSPPDLKKGIFNFMIIVESYCLNL